MRILIVTAKYFPIVGGVETQLEAMAIELAKDNEVAVAAAMGGTAHELRDGVQVHRLKTSLINGALPRLYRFIPNSLHDMRVKARAWGERAAYMPKLDELVRNSDVVHITRTDHFSYLAVEACRKHNVPCLLTPYFHPDANGIYPEGMRAHTELLNECDIVLALLETDRLGLSSINVQADKIRTLGVCPLLPDTMDAAGFRARHGMGDDPMVLFIGRMVQYKGALALMQAAEHVWKVEPRARFAFVGPSDNKTRKWLPEKLDPRIHILGAVDEQEKADAIAACDIFSMPSTSEIFPAVYLEAWSCRKPVIGGTAYGLKELIEGNNAGICSDQEPKNLADTLLKLIQSSDLRAQYAKNGFDLVEAKYSKSALLRRSLELYDEAIQRRAGEGAMTGAPKAREAAIPSDA
ncbi:MAG: glycosyltransferase family 4 protein [Neomegalonema sp.]|nr:glycosyltransferase family 4 protein [Neomegalonema sp.]